MTRTVASYNAQKQRLQAHNNNKKLLRAEANLKKKILVTRFKKTSFI
jgi:hypothetical protein